jgi:hypothetical protein
LTPRATLKKHHAHSKLAGQSNPGSPSGFPEERLRNGHEQASAIAAAAIRIHTAAMGQTHEGTEPAFHHRVRGGCAELGDEAHAAGIVIFRENEATLRHVLLNNLN